MAVAVPTATAPIVEATAQPAPAPEIAKLPSEPEASAPVVDTKPIASARPAVRARSRSSRRSRGRVTTFNFAEPKAPPPAPARPAAGRKDPFESYGDGASKPAAMPRVAKAALEPPPVKSRPARSGDSLDDLMSGVVSGSKSNSRRNTSRQIDAMLKNVQKREPAPPPKRTEPASLPSLTASDISKAMGGVKTRAAGCSKRFGQNGIADLKLTVGKDGKVSDVAIRGKLADLPIGRCVVAAARGAAFPRNSGLRFSYRIDVR